jgi:hypothetical protein
MSAQPFVPPSINMACSIVQLVNPEWAQWSRIADRVRGIVRAFCTELLRTIALREWSKWAKRASAAAPTCRGICAPPLHSIAYSFLTSETLGESLGFRKVSLTKRLECLSAPDRLHEAQVVFHVAARVNHRPTL